MTKTSIHRLNRITLALLAWGLAGSFAAQASIVSSGAVLPDPSGGSVAGGLLTVGATGVGTMTVNGGSLLTVDRIALGVGPGSNGSVTITGAGSRVFATMANNPGTTIFNLEVGKDHTGSLQVLNGASFVAGVTSDTHCQLNCRLFVSNAAGSSGSLVVSGAGSSLFTVGGMRVGHASAFTTAADGFDFGTPGGASTASVLFDKGATVTQSFVSIAGTGSGLGRTGAESTHATVTVDGAGTRWNLERASAYTSAVALLAMSSGTNATSLLQVSNGAVVTLNGSADATQLSGLNMGTAAGANASNSNSRIEISGAGSRIDFTGGLGFLNIGRGIGAVSQLDISNGGQLAGTTANALPFATIGRGGARGTLGVDGAGSLFRLEGRDGAGAGAFLHVGRFDVTAGTGAVNVTNGGRLEIDTRLTTGLGKTNQAGMIVGNGSGAQGNVLLSGAGSFLSIAGNAEAAPYVGIGRDGGTGQMQIMGGARFEYSSAHLSAVSATARYAQGEGMFLAIGANITGSAAPPTQGVLSISGAGSELVMSGNADRLVQVGQGANTQGTLNISNGGTLRSTTMLLGIERTSTGMLNLDNGTLLLDGERKGGPSPNPQGGGMGVGRSGGTGVVSMRNGSLLQITSSSPSGGLAVGGSMGVPGGTGSFIISSGSGVQINAPDANISVGWSGSDTERAIGTMVLSDAGTRVAITGSNARVLIGGSNGTGTVVVGAGSTLSSSGMMGVAHSGTASSGGNGLLVVNGTAKATDLFVGSTGILAGSGLVQGNVINSGTVSPGESPGRLTIDGAFDNRGGRVLLEVQSTGAGLFDFDEIVFTDASRVMMDGGSVEFVFLGDSNPLQFQSLGLFDLGSFFKELDSSGNAIGLNTAQRALFNNALFSASSAQYNISNFRFDPVLGASFGLSTVSAPQTLALSLLALMLMGVQRRRVQPKGSA